MDGAELVLYLPLAVNATCDDIAINGVDMENTPKNVL